MTGMSLFEYVAEQWGNPLKNVGTILFDTAQELTGRYSSLDEAWEDADAAADREYPGLPGLSGQAFVTFFADGTPCSADGLRQAVEIVKALARRDAGPTIPVARLKAAPTLADREFGIVMLFGGDRIEVGPVYKSAQRAFGQQTRLMNQHSGAPNVYVVARYGDDRVLYTGKNCILTGER